MKALVREAMRDGAVGLSTALQYAPAPYASTEELIALAAESGARWAAFTPRTCATRAMGSCRRSMRRFGSGAKRKIPVEIWHLKAAGKANWGRMPEIVAHIEQARTEQAWRSAPIPMPTRRGSTASRRSFRRGRTMAGMRSLIERLKDPATRARIRKEMETPERRRGTTSGRRYRARRPFCCRWCRIPKLLPLQGKTIAEIAKLWNKDPIDTVFDHSDRGRRVHVGGGVRDEEPDVALALQQPWVVDVQ